jgi:hypothetical protein
MRGYEGDELRYTRLSRGDGGPLHQDVTEKTRSSFIEVDAVIERVIYMNSLHAGSVK